MTDTSGAGGGQGGGAPSGPQGSPPAAGTPQGGTQQPATPPSPPASPVAPWGDGKSTWMVDNKPWYEAFVPEGPTRELLKSKNYANPLVVADSYFALNKSYVENPSRIEMPAADAKPEAWQQFYKKTGAVESPDKVDFGFGPDVKVDPKFVDFGKNLAVELGLRPDKAKLLGARWNEFVGKLNGETVAAQAASNDTAISQLKGELGDNFEPWRVQGNRVLEALKSNMKNPALRLSEADFLAVEKNIGAAPLVKLLAAIGSLSGEAAFVSAAAGGGGVPGSPEAMSQDQAADEIKRLNGDAAFQKQYTTANDPNHKEAVDRMSRLYARAGNKVKL
jgi:hypothetical protein